MFELCDSLLSLALTNQLIHTIGGLISKKDCRGSHSQNLVDDPLKSGSIYSLANCK